MTVMILDLLTSRVTAPFINTEPGTSLEVRRLASRYCGPPAPDPRLSRPREGEEQLRCEPTST